MTWRKIDMEEEEDMTHLSILHPRYFLVSILHSPLFPPFSFRHLRYPIMNSLQSPVYQLLSTRVEDTHRIIRIRCAICHDRLRRAVGVIDNIQELTIVI